MYITIHTSLQCEMYSVGKFRRGIHVQAYMYLCMYTYSGGQKSNSKFQSTHFCYVLEQHESILTIYFDSLESNLPKYQENCKHAKIVLLTYAHM